LSPRHFNKPHATGPESLGRADHGQKAVRCGKALESQKEPPSFKERNSPPWPCNTTGGPCSLQSEDLAL
jgi:hypothetical protein